MVTWLIFYSDLNMIIKTDDRPSKRLEDAIFQAHSDGIANIVQTKTLVKRNNRSSHEEYLGPVKFIVAIVGPQEQMLSHLISYIQNTALKSV